ncbi:amidohydrolase [Pseudohalioglobus lutimaris]|nr:amidohydrolase family protein [Pseudohalioglobus lutimaris]
MTNKYLLSLLLATLFGSGSTLGGATDGATQTLYHGGDIITMEGETPAYVDVVVERGGKIVYAGSRAGVNRDFAGSTEEVDLQGMTLMPGFIEPHAHPVSIGAFILANDIVAPHEWRMPHHTYPGVSGKGNYLKAVKAVIDSKQSPDRTVMIWGYHKSWHGELSLAGLDGVTGDVPTIIWQRSTHEIYLNSAAARKYQIKRGDLAPEDDAQADWENYHFWERAYQMMKGTKLAPFFGDQEMLRRGMERISEVMLNNGLTAMAEPSFPNSVFDIEYQVLKEGTEKAGAYGIYLIAGFPEQFVRKMSNEDYEQRVDSFPANYDTRYIKFMPKQFKTFGDGAIYSLALQLREPFVNCKDCHAEWIIPPEMGEQIFSYWWDQGYKIHIHITGDKAYETYLDIVERAMQRNPRVDHRTTFHHVGLFDAALAQRTADLGVEISANPYYLWALADKYAATGMGAVRAQSMVALREFTERGVPVSLHSDFAMAPADPLLLAWVAINRQIASGAIVSPRQGISVFDAMKGITITAARTFGMDGEIGSIKAGKDATFTLLTQNPFKVAPITIKDIPVAGVVYKGEMKMKPLLRPGGDRDTRGCIGSAGFAWCEKTQTCERPWELAASRDFANTQPGFDLFCQNSP